MGGRNNKLKDQKGLDQKGQAGKETHQKKSCHGSKGPFQKHMAGQKKKKKKIYMHKIEHTNSEQE